MSSYQDRLRQYDEEDVPTAYRQHVANGIRKKFANEFDFTGLSDMDVIQRHHSRFSETMTPEDYTKKLDEVYGKGFTAPAAPKETLGERVQSGAEAVQHGAKDFATSLIPFLVPEAPKVAAAVSGQAAMRGAAAAASKSIPLVSQVGFLGGHAINEAVDTATAKGLEQTAASIPVPKAEELTQQYFAKLQPSLSAKGFTNDQIMSEARHRAQNVVTGYQATTESINEDVARTQEQAAVQEPAHAAADAFFLGVGAPMIEGLLQKGVAKALGRNVATAAARPAVGVLNRLASHVRAGALIGTPGMGIQGAIEAGVQAAADNKTPHDIGQALVRGGEKGAFAGAIGGSIIGAAGAGLEGVAGLAAKPFVEAANRKQAAINAATLARTDAVIKTARDFNPHTTSYSLNGDPADAATTIIQQTHGEEAARSLAGMQAASIIENRIRLYQDANGALEGNVNPDMIGPDQGRMSGVQPVGAPVNAEGGLAPEPNAPPALQGPVGERAPQFQPPGSVPLEAGLEGTPPATAETIPLGREGVAPESAPRPAVELQKPIDVTGSGPDRTATEIAPRLADVESPPSAKAPVAPEEPVVAPTPKPRETNAAAQHVVETYRQQNKFVDKEGRDMFPQVDKARAERIAHEFHNLENAKPGTPEFEAAKKSYDALNKEVGEQYKAIKKAGYKIEFVTEDPYKNSAEMRADVRDNKRLKVLKTAPGHHPFMTPQQNDIFRAVHDFFGHAAEGYEFGPRGEEAAFQQHSATLSNASIPALASETRGQNSWVNYHPENAAKPIAERPFAEQKFGLLPSHTYEDVLHPEPAKPAEGAPKSVEPTAPLEQSPTNAFPEVEHATTEMTPEGDLRLVELGKAGKPRGKGDTSQALDQITREADKRGLKIVTDLVPPTGVSGGRIPLEKVIPWYEARGFRVTETTRIPEGQLATAKLVRDPIGQHQAEVAGKLEEIAARARARIAKKSGRVSAGFDPTIIGDYALELAADMFSKRLRKKDELASWLVDKYGDAVRPFLDKIITLAQKHFVRMFKTTGSAEKNLRTLLELGQSGRHGMNWYENTRDWAHEKFGEDGDMMLRFLAVTSAKGQTEAGAALALKAFAQWKAGMPFEGFRGDSMVGQLERIVNGENLGEGTKIQNFYEALAGNPDAVVLDRWMIDALNLKEKGSALRIPDYKIYTKVVRDLAEMNEMTPRQFQAAVWEGARIRKAHITEKTGGRYLTTKSGSARPLEDLVTAKLGGMTINEYIDATKGHLDQMEKLYHGLEPVRKGDESGHTFDIGTYEPDKQKGYVVSLVSTLVPKKVLYPAEVLKFRRLVEPLIEDLSHGDLFSGPQHLSLGVFASDAHPGMFSIDLNVTLPDKSHALRLGLLNRQESVADLGPGGEWRGNVETGFNEKKHGKQFLPPKDPTKRSAWFKQQVNRVRVFMQQSAEPKKRAA